MSFMYTEGDRRRR